MNVQHNHVTRGIMHKGECPACDKTMVLQMARRVIENNLYNHNVEPEDTTEEANKLIKQLHDVGITLTWVE